MSKTKTTIRVGGKEYTIVGMESAEYIHRVALYVDRKMKEISVATRVPDELVPTLTAINLADELMRSQDEASFLRKDIGELRAELTRLQKENTLLRSGRNPDIRRVEPRKNTNQS